ncbi:hypothetical protein [Nocardia sp. CC216A]|nr:hypothetical protein [Nocardia sp. CC216A]
MVTAIVTFLSGLTLGGLAVWALVSYTPVNPVPFVQPKDAPTVQSIIERIERERRESPPARGRPSALPGVNEPQGRDLLGRTEIEVR